MRAISKLSSQFATLQVATLPRLPGMAHTCSSNQGMRPQDLFHPQANDDVR
jgi:hypothetical protein